MRHGLALIIALLLLPTRAPADVIDGDTLRDAGARVRLYGIDAPELAQSCQRDMREWPCGAAAASALRTRIGRRAVTCNDRGADRYGRRLAVCTVGVTDLGAWMVRRGWAVAIGPTYRAQEAVALHHRRGIWAGSFMHPAQWRAAQRAAKQ